LYIWVALYAFNDISITFFFPYIYKKKLFSFL
jgi:hypothetical protein